MFRLTSDDPVSGTWLVALLVIIGFFLMFPAVTAQSSVPAFMGHVPTQRKRYGMLLLATATSFTPVIYLIYLNNWDTYALALGDIRETDPIFGWFLTLVLWCGMLSPLIALAATRVIYIWPCQMGRRVRGGWIRTKDVRVGTSQVQVYEFRNVQTDGRYAKRFVPKEQVVH